MITCGARTLVAKTCIHCGELLPASRFPKINGMYHNSWCKKCQNDVYSHLTHDHQQRTLRMAVKHRQPWCEEDFQRLDEMTAEGLPVTQIALALNRSVYAVYTVRNKLRKGLI